MKSQQNHQLMAEEIDLKFVFVGEKTLKKYEKKKLTYKTISHTLKQQRNKILITEIK